MVDVIFMAAIMALAFVPQVLAIGWSISAWKNYFSGIDIIWTVLVALLAIGYAVFVPGYVFRKIILCSLVVLWAARLAVFLFFRLKKTFPQEDPRYGALKTKWGANANRNFFVLYQLQGLAAILLAIPFWIYIMHPSESMHWTEIIGIVLCVAALAGEAIADEQLRRFKTQAANRGKTLQTGLWKYSRHPNYFFEWLVWVSFALMAVSAPRSGLAFLAPAIMLITLLRWTGVPANEANAKTSRGEEYLAYQKSTSSFFPWFPKKAR